MSPSFRLTLPAAILLPTWVVPGSSVPKLSSRGGTKQTKPPRPDAISTEKLYYKAHIYGKVILQRPGRRNSYITNLTKTEKLYYKFNKAHIYGHVLSQRSLTQFIYRVLSQPELEGRAVTAKRTSIRPRARPFERSRTSGLEARHVGLRGLETASRD